MYIQWNKDIFAQTLKKEEYFIEKQLSYRNIITEV